MHLVPSNIHVTALGTPTEQALLSTIVQGGRHLDASVALDAVKLLFITGTIVNDGFVQPFASFNR
jgi:hypothetical protein